MRADFRLSDLIPAELKVEAVDHRHGAIVVAAHDQSRSCKCPECGTTSQRVHSRYLRMIADLPCAGQDRIAPSGSTLRLLCRLLPPKDFCRAVMP